MRETITVISGCTFHGTTTYFALSDATRSVKTCSHAGSPTPWDGAYDLAKSVAHHLVDSGSQPTYSYTITFPEAIDRVPIPDWIRENYKSFSPLTIEEQAVFNEGIQAGIVYSREYFARSKK